MTLSFIIQFHKHLKAASVDCTTKTQITHELQSLFWYHLFYQWTTI